jgi:hypothetical protein
MRDIVSKGLQEVPRTVAGRGRSDSFYFSNLNHLDISVFAGGTDVLYCYIMPTELFTSIQSLSEEGESKSMETIPWARFRYMHPRTLFEIKIKPQIKDTKRV